MTFFVDPENSDVFMSEADGGILMDEAPRTNAKYMSEARAMFGVMLCRKTDGTVEGDRISPFNYTRQKVVGPVAFEKCFWEEVERVNNLKTTGTSRSKYLSFGSNEEKV